MGGGDGAKERRRLKRLQQKTQQGAVENGKTNDGGGGFDGRKNEQIQNPKAKISNGFDTTTKRKNRSNKDFGNNPKKKKTTTPSQPANKKRMAVNTATKKKKKNSNNKSKKPKHLKRKLEQVDENDNDTKTKLLNELADWEHKKTIYSHQSNTKKPKVEVHRDANISTDEMVDESTKISTADKNEDIEKDDDDVDFPRTASPTISKRAINKRGNKDTKSSYESVKENHEDLEGEDNNDDGDGANNGGKKSKEKRTKSTMNKKEETTSNKTDGDDKAEVPSSSSSSSSSSDDDDDDDDDDEMIETDQQRRGQRGRKRKGRKDTAKEIEESKKVGEEEEEIGQEHQQQDKVRYCIGRKPVTDFVVGQKYSAKVVYVKPFGVFFDIGCHSDAFCHVSRLQDDYVESPQELFKEGDTTEARVVEINRREKRITVSLQSEVRLKDEMASIEARTKRKEIRKSKQQKSTKKRKAIDDNYVNHHHQTDESNVEIDNKETSSKNNNFSSNFGEEAPTAPKRQSSIPPQPKDESEMTPTELKRARKLARRAARREAQESAATD